jgi:glycosyltransferase involved in cell wall biosynthesis
MAHSAVRRILPSSRQSRSEKRVGFLKLLVTANKVPFMPGGADYHVHGLVDNLRLHGHEVELLQFPFRFSPEAEVQRLMDFCEATDLNQPNGVAVDKVISLQFPGYGVRHEDHRVWIMHQHRSVYELYEELPPSSELEKLRDSVQAFDERVLGRAGKLFANSQRVAQRLQDYNGLAAQPLYHPPHAEGQFYCDASYDYLFCPSRLELLKRQDLIIRAAALVQSNVCLLLGGDGGQKPHYQQLIARLGVENKVKLIGRFSEAEKRVLYARSLGVVFVPRDEDYGYITLEAMLSAKPVITCSDSGGPLEFVRDGETGTVVEPEPEQLAAAIDALVADKQRARRLGESGLEQYRAAAISWAAVVDALLAP